MPVKKAFLDQLSQAHCSATYSITCIVLGIWFGGWFWVPIMLVIGLLFGFAERKFINKRIETPPAKLAVMITGCSSGFGNILARRLSHAGVVVFAGVRNNKDAEAVKKLNPDNIVPLIMDVTDSQQIVTAAESVKETLQQQGLKLHALINNAGYGYYMPVEAIDMEKYKNMFEVNVFGAVATTQAFLPLLREFSSEAPLSSRVINISSGAGRIVLPGAGTYCSTKFALEAINDALRMELRPWGINVILVEPGRFHTEFQEKAYTDPVFNTLVPLKNEVETHYATLMHQQNEHSAKKKRPSSELCVDVIEDALFDTNPLPRYLAGSDVQTGVPLLHHIHSNFQDKILGGNWRFLKTHK